MKTVEWIQWTSQCSLAVDTDSDTVFQQALDAVHTVSATVEQAINRWSQKSEIYRINQIVRSDGFAEIAISKTLADILYETFVTYELTEGAFDPRVEDSLHSLGYGVGLASTQISVGADGIAYGQAVPQCSLTDQVKVTQDGAEFFLTTSATLDLIALGKSFAADQASRIAATASGAAVMVNLGGDISSAGAEYTAPEFGWKIHVQDLETDPAAEVLLVRNGAIATSSSQKRRWGEKEAWHHIINPLTGLSAKPDLKTATVIADRATVANALSTACIVWGKDASQQIKQKNFPARLVQKYFAISHHLWPENSELSSTSTHLL